MNDGLETGLEPEIVRGGAPSRREAGGKDLVRGVALVWSADLLIGVVLGAAGVLKKGAFDPGVLLAITLVSGTWTSIVTWWFVCRKQGLSFRNGFALTKPGRATALGSVALGVGMAAVATILILQLGTGESRIAKMASRPEGMAALALMALTLPFVEELYYRGFIYPVLRRSWGAGSAVVVTALWFGLAHVYQLFGDPIGVVVVGLAGLVFTVQRHRSGSLTPSVLTHWTYNATLVAASLA